MYDRRFGHYFMTTSMVLRIGTVQPVACNPAVIQGNHFEFNIRMSEKYFLYYMDKMWIL